MTIRSCHYNEVAMAYRPGLSAPSRPRRLGLGLCLWLAGARAGHAWADHGGPLRSADMSPLMVALLAGLLALIAGLLVVVIVMVLTRKERSSE